MGLLPFTTEKCTHFEALKITYAIGRPYTVDSEENAFDHYPWTDSEIENAVQKLKQIQISNKKLDENLSQEWCSFYNKNSRSFFKDRNWVLQEFQQLYPTHHHFKILDIGCGVGNTSIPIIEKMQTNYLYRIYACDYSASAISHFPKSDSIDAFVHDALNPFPLDNIDVATLFFVMSAIKPENWLSVFTNIFTSLKPGGVLCFRDYGYFDLTQLRFKPEQCISDGLYQRSDGTLTYFAKLEFLSHILNNVGFTIQQLVLDKRVIVNRKTKVKMKRVWLHGTFKKEL